MINLLSDQLVVSKEFYTALFDFRVDFDSDWFVHLISEDQELELGIIDYQSQVVPPGLSSNQSGMYLTFVVEDVDKLHEVAVQEKLEVIEEPKDTFYGQRRLLLKDPNGVVVDISAPIPNFQFS